MRKLKTLLIAAAAAAVTGCGGGSDDTLVSPGGGGGGPGGGPGGGGGGGGTPQVSMGSGFGANFMPGVLQVGVASLSAGGSTGVTATLVTSSGDLYTGEATITFNSPCVAQGLATITTPVDTTTGIANATYAATGCSGTDVITATATVEGTTMTATGTVQVAAAAIGSIQFISATPENISLKGTGGAGRSETSTVVFRVVDSSGGPVPNAEVTFALNTTTGGVTVSPTPSDPPAMTDFDGRVQAVVQAGTVATAVRVTATVTSTAISTQSDQLTISTGLPDQDSFSLSIETLNPEAWALDGTTVPVTVRMSDRFNNPVPDGTAVTLWAEGGQIGSQCLTVDGACTVNWVSQSPRPLETGPAPGERAGRVTILATAIGEESFVDANGNGVFDGPPDTFSDIPEPWRDDNENGVRDETPLEPFFDFDSDGNYTVANSRFDGLLCDAGAALCGNTTTAVYDIGVIAMAGCDFDPAEIDLDGPLPNTFGGTFQDMRRNPLPAGTTVAFEAANGTIKGPSSFTYPNTLEPVEFSVFVDADNQSNDGPLFVTVTCPSGLSVTMSGTVTD